MKGSPWNKCCKELWQVTCDTGSFSAPCTHCFFLSHPLWGWGCLFLHSYIKVVLLIPESLVLYTRSTPKNLKSLSQIPWRAVRFHLRFLLAFQNGPRDSGFHSFWPTWGGGGVIKEERTWQWLGEMGLKLTDKLKEHNENSWKCLASCSVLWDVCSQLLIDCTCF